MKHFILAAMILFTSSAFANTSSSEAPSEATDGTSSGRIYVAKLSCMAANGLSFILAERAPEDNLVNVGFGPVIGRPYYITQTSLLQNSHLILTMTSDIGGVMTSGLVGNYTLQLVGQVDQQGEFSAYTGVGTVDKTLVNVLTGIPFHSPPVGVTCRAVLAQK